MGIGLLIWCIMAATRAGGWDRVVHAGPAIIVGLVAASILSQIANILIFWLTIRPIQPIRLWDLTIINLVVSLLNYAPIRLGLAARVTYHIRVDRMPWLTIGAWLAAIVLTLAATMSAIVAAALIHPSFDWKWGLLNGGFLAASGFLLQAVGGWALLQRYGRGLDVILLNPASLWGSMMFRCADLGAYAWRIWLASTLLGLTFNPDQILILAIAALTIGMNPLGRFGFREATVAFVASLLAGPDARAVDGIFAQLALVESAGEAIAVIPLGALASLRFLRRLRAAPRVSETGGSV